ncbi:hypothetical protein pdam_00024059 [Pocillopora damicornis]|uniref:Uncharacterized protein n=1 Tax=Pocillopora damicornis TaxID=46731 RepID=A0A3M6UH39_POCDA|nr:hypothetical protein pdam_00024059 [Pocillopora damicornis]
MSGAGRPSDPWEGYMLFSNTSLIGQGLSTLCALLEGYFSHNKFGYVNSLYFGGAPGVALEVYRVFLSPMEG